MSACLSVYLSVCMPVCLPVRLSTCLSTCLPVCLSSVCLSAYMSACLSVYMSVCMPVCLPVFLSACLSTCPSVCSSCPYRNESSRMFQICRSTPVATYTAPGRPSDSPCSRNGTEDNNYTITITCQCHLVVLQTVLVVEMKPKTQLQPHATAIWPYFRRYLQLE